MWYLIIISLGTGDPVITSIPDFTTKESCMEMRTQILEKLDHQPRMYCMYSED